MLHDDYALWLLEIIPELFSEVVFFYGTIFDYDFIRSLSPNTIFCLQTERSFIRVPELEGNMLQFVAQQERQKKTNDHLAEFLKSDRRFERS